ncbi:hypothetical protein M569_09155 [Genlisea aurea]|uniref:NPH3 domain-containing protein n=1 Tax=Genlisea aurea TaxID=192259 RepID=S8CLG9_9LAMI|nr:hypothetical protein M569_09155 [Genlisea aurea]
MKFMKLGSKPDNFQSDGNNIRYVATELASDVVVRVGEAKFYLHKFPLLSKSSRLQKLVSSADESNGGDEIDVDGIPGGAAAFELCAKFCYGMTVTLNAHNVVAARCAAEYLGMHEAVEKGNLAYKIDVFLASTVLRSWRDSIVALRTTRGFSPHADELNLAGRCADAVAAKASVHPSRVDWPYSYSRGRRREDGSTTPDDWFAEDLCELEIDLFERVVAAMKKAGRISGEAIGKALKAYAHAAIRRGLDDGPSLRAVLEAIVSLLPPEKGCVSCGFLFKLLRAAIFAGSGESVRSRLVKRIGLQLEEASVDDLLIRASEGDETVYDVRLVRKIVKEFMARDHRSSEIEEAEENNGMTIVTEASKLMVAKLVDGYLAEVSKDPNLSISTFIAVAETVSTVPRPAHDALYTAIDTYLKEHPGISKSDRKKICRLMECKKLSAEASLHAVQNERLPLRVVVQVIFFEQVRAAASSGSTTPELPKAIKDLNYGSCGSSRSATNADEDWDAVASAEELRALRGELAALRLSNNGVADKATAGKAKGLVLSKRILSKIWSSSKGGQQQNENTGSDSSGSVGEDAKTTPARRGRHSVS